MHPNPTFRQTETQNALTFARARAFGTLAVNSDPVPLTAHIPFLLTEDGQAADLHLVRSNPIRKALGPAVLTVTGPDAYISPDWYGADDQVPTWNYVAVRLTGTLEALPAEHLPDLLARQSAFFEDRLAPKPPWTMDKLTGETEARFMRMILPFRFHITDVQSTFKLGQNKPAEVRKAAAEQLTTGFGSDLTALSDMMRNAEETG
ncbi:FMN-binding negative transcriptional regulator [Pacificoceanicola onchidii]|uniref:FMN-binding negative transcriptional regulator n=1 Tax=Pacificoceanicola onchidii TaxID=2562685 RepID=UPI0010A3DA5F|nr:FMN-binding negative transcriptional regulator [Pacificoceanicola onchidii]